MTIQDIKDFGKYILKQLVTEPFKALIFLLRSLLFPKAWFYILFFVFAIRVIFLKEFDPFINRVMMFGLIILLLWKEYTDGNWKFELREAQRKRTNDQLVKIRKDVNDQIKEEESDEIKEEEENGN